MRKQKINKVKEQKRNNYGSLMTIIKYNKYNDIIVEFENGYITKSEYGAFKKGQIKSPFDKSVYKTGYLGEGKYNVKIDDKVTLHYQYWRDMLKRCYDEKELKRRPTYEDKTVCEEWHNFQNFAKWFDENYYEVDGEIMQLDKDILSKGNKIYSPETCVFVPQRINTLFVKNDSRRGKYPIGVNLNQSKSKYLARCSVYNNSTHKKEKKTLGTFETPEEAFYKYKEFKEQYIKEVAEEYKGRIPIKLYNAMYEYKVDIDD